MLLKDDLASQVSSVPDRLIVRFGSGDYRSQCIVLALVNCLLRAILKYMSNPFAALRLIFWDAVGLLCSGF